MNTVNRVFIVTGATSGLGLAVTHRLRHLGALIIAMGRNEEAGRKLQSAFVRFVRGNVRSEADAGFAVRLAVETFGELHGLINCAGVAHGERIVGREGLHSLEAFGQVVGTNLIGTFNMIRAAAEPMTKNAPNEQGERGVIINTASVAAFDGQIGQAAYAASKGGIVSMTLPLAREFAQHGIRVVTIAPGVFATPMVQAFSERVRARLTESLAFPTRFGAPDEFAQMVTHVVENPMLNGETIRLDGALRMGAR